MLLLFFCRCGAFEEDVRGHVMLDYATAFSVSALLTKGFGLNITPSFAQRPIGLADGYELGNALMSTYIVLLKITVRMGNEC